MKLDRGLVQVYTGNGKGKTTAALGLSLRALGHGLKVCIVQFMKGGGPYGEHLMAGTLPGLTIHPTGGAGWVRKGDPAAADIAEARRGLELARENMTSGRFDLVILDEINGAIDFGLIGVEDALALIAAKPPRCELVLTGRNAAAEVIAAADLVSEMREVKHYFKQGVDFRVGIER